MAARGWKFVTCPSCGGKMKSTRTSVCMACELSLSHEDRVKFQQAALAAKGMV
jgi:reverse gyrase